MRTTKQNISTQVNGKVISFDDFDFDFGYLYVFFDQTTDELCAGGVFNAGISKDYSIIYDHDFSIDENLQALYEHIIEENIKLEEEKKENKNPRIGQYVYDTYYGKKRKVQAISDNGKLYFIGSEHEPVFRNEFIFPLPKNKK